MNGDYCSVRVRGRLFAAEAFNARLAPRLRWHEAIIRRGHVTARYSCRVEDLWSAFSIAQSYRLDLSVLGEDNKWNDVTAERIISLSKGSDGERQEAQTDSPAEGGGESREAAAQ